VRPLLLCVIALLALALPTAARAADPEMWQSPSGNVSCELQGARLRCDMRRIGVTPPSRPASCMGDWGHAFVIGRSGSRGRRLCITDAVGGPGTPTIRYGRVWRRGGFRCSVASSGVRCVNGRGHGFALRIGRQRLF
jgi:uncharacterized protein DUF6636